MKKVVITTARRTPIGKFLGAFKEITAVELGVWATKAVLKESGIEPKLVEEVIFGNARQAGNRPNPARQIAYLCGIPYTASAYTLCKTCGSGLKAIVLAYQAIVLGDAEIVIAGGTENMTRTPFMLDRARWGYRLGDAPLIDGMYHDGFICPLCNLTMGQTAENLAEKYEITRDEQDKFAMQTQHKCEKARKSDRFKDEIVPVEVKDRKGNINVIDTDEHPRDGVTMEKLARLPPVFKKDGTVHAGNSSGICDAAAAVIVMSEEKAKELGLKPMAEITGYATVGVDPSIMGIAPVGAINKLCKKIGCGLEDFDLIELNEAFAAQVIACDRELNLPMEKVNVNGGAIALGHPIGATGCRIVVTLLHEMLKQDVKSGLASLCMSGGMGMAVSFER